MVAWMLSWVTRGSATPGVQSGSGSPPIEWHPPPAPAVALGVLTPATRTRNLRFMRAPSKPDAKPERRQKQDEQNEQSDSSIAQGNDAQSWEIDTGARLRLIPPPGPQDALHLARDCCQAAHAPQDRHGRSFCPHVTKRRQTTRKSR